MESSTKEVHKRRSVREMKKQLDELLRDGKIRESGSSTAVGTLLPWL
jgi:hypothetical protein